VGRCRTEYNARPVLPRVKPRPRIYS